jgi:hypothetical protein
MSLTLEQRLELGRVAISIKNWKWLPGMRWIDSDEGTRSGRVDEYDVAMPYDAIPDFEDPATLGCLLHLARLKTGRADLFAYHIGENVWRVGNFQSWATLLLKQSNEAEALLICLKDI